MPGMEHLQLGRRHFSELARNLSTQGGHISL